LVFLVQRAVQPLLNRIGQEKSNEVVAPGNRQRRGRLPAIQRLSAQRNVRAAPAGASPVLRLNRAWGRAASAAGSPVQMTGCANFADFIVR